LKMEAAFDILLSANMQCIQIDYIKMAMHGDKALLYMQKAL